MTSRFPSFLAELKRRKVARVALVYAVVGIGVIEGSNLLFDAFEVPRLVWQIITFIIVLGFPVALVLAWAYEVRPEEPADARPEGFNSRSGEGDVSAETSGSEGSGALRSTWGSPETAERSAGETPARPTPGPGPATDANSVVVLPLENLSPDPDNAFFADGLTEEIIADLSKVKALKVISRTSAMAFKGTSKTIPEIADQLNVRFVLEGSVRREGRSLRITAQLIDASSDAHLWAEKYSGTVEDVFDLQERLSRRIVDALKVTLSPEEDRRLSDRPLTDIQAHDIWLRARQHTLTLTLEGSERGRELVEQALAIAGDNALLHATLAWIHAVRWGQLEAGPEEELALLKTHAAKAMELDPELPWSLFSTAIVHHREGDMQGFFRWGKKALEIERDSHTLAVMGLYLSYSGRTVEARNYAQEAASRDPLSWLTTHVGPHADLLDGNADGAFKQMRDLADRLAPGESWPAFTVAYAAFQAGHTEEARVWFKKSIAGGAPFYSNWGQLYLHLLDGDYQGAQGVLSHSGLIEVAGRAGMECYQLASCYAGMGRDHDAFEWLERAVDLGFSHHRFMGEYDGNLASLRGDPRFGALVAKAREVEEGLEV